MTDRTEAPWHGLYRHVEIDSHPPHPRRRQVMQYLASVLCLTEGFVNFTRNHRQTNGSVSSEGTDLGRSRRAFPCYTFPPPSHMGQDLSLSPRALPPTSIDRRDSEDRHLSPKKSAQDCYHRKCAFSLRPDLHILMACQPGPL